MLTWPLGILVWAKGKRGRWSVFIYNVTDIAIVTPFLRRSLLTKSLFPETAMFFSSLFFEN